MLQQQRIEADETLPMTGAVGDFFVPGKGIVYLYDRSNDSTKAPGHNQKEMLPTKTGSRINRRDGL